MTVIAKKRIIKSFEKLEKPLKDQIDLLKFGYPENYMVFYDHSGKKFTTIPLETEDTYYLVKVDPPHRAKSGKSELEEDNDFNSSPEDSFDSDYEENHYEQGEDMDDDY